MIDLHDALDEVRLHMDRAPAGSAVRVKLMKSAAALIEAMTAQAQDRPERDPCEVGTAYDRPLSP